MNGPTWQVKTIIHGVGFNLYPAKLHGLMFHILFLEGGVGGDFCTRFIICKKGLSTKLLQYLAVKYLI